MALRTARSKELSKLIGDLVRIYLQNPGENSVSSVNAVEGVIVDVSDNFVYVGEEVASGYTAMVDVNFIYAINLVGMEVELVDGVSMPEDGGIH